MKKKALSFALLALLPLTVGCVQVLIPDLGLNLTEYSIFISLLVNFVFLKNGKITRDSLTKLLNKDAFSTTLYEKMNKKKAQENLYLLMCDIDDFKIINDTHGHLTGDDALATVALVLSDVSEKYKAVPARVGGDEFAIVIECLHRNRSKLSLKKFKKFLIRTSAKKNILLKSVSVAQSTEKPMI